MKKNPSELSPKEIVEELDRYIIGQNKAKRSVAVALRNRYRRQMLGDDIRDEVTPKNIIMIGPTGVGKTEIARRLSRLTGAPFLKVEATKFTEVGYVGRDVESMIRDLMSAAVSMVKTELQETVSSEAEQQAEERLLDLLLPGIGKKKPDMKDIEIVSEQSGTRERFREMLREGRLDDKPVEVNVTSKNTPSIEIFSGSGVEGMDMMNGLGNLGSIFGNKKKKKSMPIKEARKIILAEEKDRLVDHDQVVEEARRRVQEMGMIFIDEIDKVASKENRSGGDVSREGVQRDILPIVEGSTVNTKYGLIDTSHILFIAAGAFHTSKPSDLIPELQGRFPIRVELDDLDASDFEQILTQPQNALTRQYTLLIGTEGVNIEFKEDGVKRISQIAAEVNSRTENIGARRLHTIMEILLEDISFNAPDFKGKTIEITADYVNSKLDDVVVDQDLSRYIL